MCDPIKSDWTEVSRKLQFAYYWCPHTNPHYTVILCDLYGRICRVYIDLHSSQAQENKSHRIKLIEHYQFVWHKKGGNQVNI